VKESVKFGPRYSTIPADVLDDPRFTLIHYQVIAELGLRINRAGWCHINQTKLAKKLGKSRQAVNKAIGELVAWGYVERRGQALTKRNICFYRVIMDRRDPMSGPRQLPDCGANDADLSDDQASCGDDTSGIGMSSIGDTSVASNDDTGVNSVGDTTTTPRNINDPPNTTSAPAAREGRDDSIDRFMNRIASLPSGGQTDRDARQREIRAYIANVSADVLNAAADELVGDDWLPTLARVQKVIAKVRSTAASAASATANCKTITQAEDPAAFAAWEEYADNNENRQSNADARIIHKLIYQLQCTTIQVPSLYPPGYQAAPEVDR
jgi:MarR family